MSFRDYITKNENTSDPDDIPGTLLRSLQSQRKEEARNKKLLRAKEWVEKEGIYTDLQNDFEEYKKDMLAADIEPGTFDDFIQAMHDMARDE